MFDKVMLETKRVQFFLTHSLYFKVIVSRDVLLKDRDDTESYKNIDTVSSYVYSPIMY